MRRVIVDPSGAGTGFANAGTITNGVAFDRGGRHAVMFSAPGNRATGPGIDVARIQKYIERGELDTVVDLGGVVSLLLPDAKAHIGLADSAAVPVSFALVVRELAPTLELPGIVGSLQRVRGVLVEGTRREFPDNYGRMLVDGATAFTVGLDGYWAAEYIDPESKMAPANEEIPNSIHIVPPRPVAVAAIEFVHADAVGFSPEFDLKHYRIWGREKRDEAWRRLVEVEHDKPVSRERILIPGTPRLAEMRLEVVEPNFLPGGNVARLVELFLWSPVEEAK